MRFKPLLALVLVCGLAPVSAVIEPQTAVAQPGEAAAGKINLRPKFVKGAQHRFRMNLDITGAQAMPDMGEQTTRTTQEIGLLLRVKEASTESGATLELVYESLKLKLDSPFMQMEFDSSKKSDESQAADMLRPIVGLTLIVKADKDGNITSVSGAESLSGGPAAAIAGQFAGDDIVKGMFGPMVSINKGTGQAAVGESWTNTDKISGALGGMTVSTTNTLKSHSGGKAHIDIKGQVTLDATGAGTLSIKESTITGSAEWNTESGMLDSMETRQKLSVDQKQGDMNVSTRQEMKMTVKREK